MKKSYIFAIILSLFLIAYKPLDQFPEAEITNGLIRARLFLPDAEKGYYRGSRFDWSGVMPELKYNEHTYFGQWFDKYSPTLHDAIMGPVQDFAPVGYDEAKVGDGFLKVGIGVVAKSEETRYSFVTPYQVLNPGVWTVKKKRDEITFFQKLNDKEYAYEYKKTVQLVKGKPEMVLRHSLKNTEKKIIETSVYNHNFFMLDKQTTGPEIVIKFKFNPTVPTPVTSELGKIDANQIVFLKEFAKNEHLYYSPLQGFTNDAKDYNISVENLKTGAGVRITSDQPLSKLVFWSASTTVCPEPYIKISINPGEEFSWNYFYEFYTFEKR